MTSQKRYRHHQDSGNNRDRFKDVPPRFKRQKSSSSPTRPLSPSHAEKDGKTTHTHEADSPQLNSAILPAASVAAAREPNNSGVYQFEENVASQFGSDKDNVQTQRLPSHTTWKQSQKIDNIDVASPWENQDYLSVGFQQPAHVALGTHFGYKANLSPLYSWAPVDAAHFYSPSDVTGDSIWTHSYAGQRILHSSGYTSGNENLASGQYMHPYEPQDVCWNLPSSVHYPTSASPPVKNSPSPLPTEISKEVNNQEIDKSKDNQRIDYSDPDIRTIEMLRELERVADQKERENEDFGADRKSLVSHHLRMLMCAVDRYTEGIEDDLAVTSRHDEVRPSSDSRGSTPGVAADLVINAAHEQTSDVTRNTMGQHLPLQSPQNKEQSVWDEPTFSKTSTKLPNQNEECYVLSSHASLFLSEQNVAEGSDTAAWDLWSSPTFDFCNVLTNHNSDISRSTKERRPLYQRQLANY